MLKILLKKQFQELVSPFTMKKDGSRRKWMGNALFLLLFLLLYGSFSALFFLMSFTISEAMVEAGFGWLLFSVMGMTALGLGVVIGTLGGYNSIYTPKDNELLLSLPIPPNRVLLARILALYLVIQAFLFCVTVPAMISYGIAAGFSAGTLLCQLLYSLSLGLLALSLACILGRLIAAAVSRMRSKNLFTVLLSLAFIVLYFYLNSNLQGILEGLARESAALGTALGRKGNPLYLIGLAGTGDAPCTLLFAAASAVIFFAVYKWLSASFLRLATAKNGDRKRSFRESSIRGASPGKALLRKEWEHFLNSPAYMLNCALGTVLLPAAAVLVLWKGRELPELLALFPGDREGILTVGAAFAACALTCMNDLTASSLSLEGETLWILRASPLPVRSIYRAKLGLHLLLTAPPMLLLLLALEHLLRLPGAGILLVLLTCLLFICVSALLGLTANILFPNLSWVNETAAVKQSLSVVIGLFGNMILAAALFLPYFLVFDGKADGVAYLAVCSLILAAAAAGLLLWCRTAGERRWEALG